MRTRAGNKRGALCVRGRAWTSCPHLRAPSLPRLRVSLGGVLLSVKRLPAYHSVNFVSLTSQKRTLGGDVYRDPRATDAPLLLSEGASHGGGPSQKLAAALVRPQRFLSEGLKRCGDDYRSQVVQALIRARRLFVRQADRNLRHCAAYDDRASESGFGPPFITASARLWHNSTHLRIIGSSSSRAEAARLFADAIVCRTAMHQHVEMQVRFMLGISTRA